MEFEVHVVDSFHFDGDQPQLSLPISRDEEVLAALRLFSVLPIPRMMEVDGDA